MVVQWSSDNRSRTRSRRVGMSTLLTWWQQLEYRWPPLWTQSTTRTYLTGTLLTWWKRVIKRQAQTVTRTYGQTPRSLRRISATEWALVVSTFLIVDSLWIAPQSSTLMTGRTWVGLTTFDTPHRWYTLTIVKRGTSCSTSREGTKDILLRPRRGQKLHISWRIQSLSWLNRRNRSLKSPRYQPRSSKIQVCSATRRAIWRSRWTKIHTICQRLKSIGWRVETRRSSHISWTTRLWTRYTIQGQWVSLSTTIHQMLPSKCQSSTQTTTTTRTGKYRKEVVRSHSQSLPLSATKSCAWMAQLTLSAASTTLQIPTSSKTNWQRSRGVVRIWHPMGRSQMRTSKTVSWTKAFLRNQWLTKKRRKHPWYSATSMVRRQWDEKQASQVKTWVRKSELPKTRRHLRTPKANHQ